jgi:hypothetical protein
MNVPEIVGLCLTLFSIYLVRRAIYSFRESVSSTKWPFVLGKIIKSKAVKLLPTGNNRTLFVEYEYSVNGKNYSGKRDSFYTLTGQEALEQEIQHNKSRKVKVYYDPKDPKKSALVTGPRDDKKFSDIILGFI